MADHLPATRSAALATVDLNHPLADLESALRLADTLSRSDLVPRSLAGRSANVFHVLMTGHALGLHWTEALRVIYSAGPGQIGLRGQFLLSRVRLAGHRYTITEGEDSCTFTLVRGDTEETFEATFTIEDAIRGGLARRNDNGDVIALSRDNKPLPWQAWTKRMLLWRAVSNCVSIGAPEVALGFVIEGAEPASEPEPEVVLTPQAPAPPDAGQAATGTPAARVLAEMDQEYAPAQPAMGGNPEDPQVGGNPGTGDGETFTTPGGHPVNPVTAATSSGDKPSPGRRALERQLAEKFSQLGWDPERHRTSMLSACTMFAGRRVGSVRELTPGEIGSLTTHLVRIATAHEPDHQVVALADQVEAWREKFEQTDPDGYQRIMEER